MINFHWTQVGFAEEVAEINPISCKSVYEMFDTLPVKFFINYDVSGCSIGLKLN